MLAECRKLFLAKEFRPLGELASLFDPLTEEFLERAGIRPGMRVLDAGCGAGNVAFAAAKLVGRGGRVTGVDGCRRLIGAARFRAARLRAANVTFLLGDATEMRFEHPYDAVVGRGILGLGGDPAAAVRVLREHLRPGGILALQELDFGGVRSAPHAPAFERGVRWVAEALRRSGGQPEMGLALPAVFRKAGMPRPGLDYRAVAAAAPESPAFRIAAAAVKLWTPAIRRMEIASAAEMEIEGLEERMRDEAVARGSVIVLPPLVGAWARRI